jgi:hypothetical protein
VGLWVGSTHWEHLEMKRRASHSLQKQLVMLALFLPLVMAISGCQSDRVGPLEASPTRSMKGYELYSWQMQGDSQMIFRPFAGQGVRHLNFPWPARSEQYA